MTHPAAKLFALGFSGWRDLLRAQRALLRARRQLRTEPLGSLAIRASVDPATVTGDARRANEIALAVMRTAERGLFRPYCLVQSLALRELLLADGITGVSIRIGVRRHRGVFQAHAWVRWGDVVLGDSAEHVATFTEVDDLRVMGET
ncbi:MAG: lasso peptide biosynthesis B2 protein [Gemmatimonadaceae bacterium]|nr:lasso peptide biosynthesis B2 protein [Gemmatimonadaceae bacterium]